MSIDLHALGSKIIRSREQLCVTLEELSDSSGINKERLHKLETGELEPTGDEILIIADYFRTDYKFFISNEKLNAFESTETLFRRYGNELNKNDRWAIQECLYLAECESFIDNELKITYENFSFEPIGTYAIGNGRNAAKALRSFFSYPSNIVPLDIYKDFRKLGIKIFRRKLENSSISGMCIKHPSIGSCIIVNYTEDVYRQRFTVAHEVGHAIFDFKDDFTISFTKWNSNDLKEIRANHFASEYLFPAEFIKKIPNVNSWDREKIITWSNKLKANPIAFGIALKDNNLIADSLLHIFKEISIPRDQKDDPELLNIDNAELLSKRVALLELGLSFQYIQKCITALNSGYVSENRVVEMFLTDYSGYKEILWAFNLREKK